MKSLGEWTTSKEIESLIFQQNSYNSMPGNHGTALLPSIISSMIGLPDDIVLKLVSTLNVMLVISD
jgi:hypothetical protein